MNTKLGIHEHMNLDAAKRKLEVATSHIHKTKHLVKNPARTINLRHNKYWVRGQVRHAVNTTTHSDFLQKQGKLQIGKNA